MLWFISERESRRIPYFLLENFKLHKFLVMTLLSASSSCWTWVILLIVSCPGREWLRWFRAISVPTHRLSGCCVSFLTAAPLGYRQHESLGLRRRPSHVSYHLYCSCWEQNHTPPGLRLNPLQVISVFHLLPGTHGSVFDNFSDRCNDLSTGLSVCDVRGFTRLYIVWSHLPSTIV